MPKFDANLTMLFTEVDFPERFARAAAAGFEAVEFLFPYDWPAAFLADKLAQYGLQQVLFNLPAGNWKGGERGIAVLSDRVAEFREGVRQAARYAQVLPCSRVNCLAGLVPQKAEAAALRRTLVDNIRYAADVLAAENVVLLVEALNCRDVPGFYLSRTADTLDLIDEAGHPNVKYQYDIYHMQIMEGDLCRTIADNVDRIGHIQLADNPGRHEPGTGEIHFENLFKAIDAAGYQGWIGCEYIPSGRTEDSLNFLKFAG